MRLFRLLFFVLIHVITLAIISPSTCFAGFTDTGVTLPGMVGSIAWGDYDSDGDMDLAMMGTANGTIYSKIYRKNADGTFTDIAAPLQVLGNGSLAWGDYDNDGDLDLLVSGYSWIYITEYTKLYRNDNGTFVENTSTALTGLSDGAVAWGDYDNDGRLDFVATGYSSTYGSRIVRLYHNNGDGTFTNNSTSGLPAIEYAAAAWGDYDNDGDLDLALCGSASSGSITRVYRNNGNGTFTSQTSLTAVYDGSIAWADYDTDGDLDLAVTGTGASSARIAKIYTNNGSGAFTENTSAGLTGVSNSSLAWGDYDNDGKVDLALSGQPNSTTNTAKIYRNNGDGTFSDINAGLYGLSGGCVTFGDYDADNDVDLLVAGWDGSGWYTKLYRNTPTTANTAPSAPNLLSNTPGGSGVVFSWTAQTDSQTPLAGLSYNLRIGTTSGGKDIFSAMAISTGGRRLIPALGNAQKKTSWLIKGLTTGKTYYWSVQAIDSAYIASGWSSERTFTLCRISGRVKKADGTGIAGVTMTVTPGGSTQTDSNGYYEVLMPPGWIGTIAPSKSPYAFYPSIRSYSSPATDQANQDYTTVKIAGTVTDVNGSAMAGVTLSSNGTSPNTATTDSSGNYELWVGSGWSGNITPSITRRTLVPANRSLSNVTADQSGQNFSGTWFTNTGTNLDDLSAGSAVWVDYDNDGDLDLLQNGSWSIGSGIDTTEGRLYRNDSGTFTQINAHGYGANMGELDAADYDRDGDVDVAVVGGGGTNYANVGSTVRNDAGTFNYDLNLQEAVKYSAVDWGDYDNDGKLDLAVCGDYSDSYSSHAVTKLYHNSGAYLSQISTSFTAADWGDVAWGDYDNDGDLDLAVNGSGPSNTLIYQNNGNSGFTSINSSIPAGSKLSWVDYNNDGLLDLSVLYSSTVHVYRNNGSGSFSDIASMASDSGTFAQSPAWGDFDNDGDPDLATYTNTGSKIAIYKNNLTSFTEIGDVSGLAGAIGKVVWGDFDSDGDLDLAVFSYTNGKIFRNDGAPTNTTPTAPSSLSATLTANDVTFSWNAASDAQTVAAGLTYNLRIGSTPGDDDIFSGMANLSSGLRRVSEMGNVQKRLTWKLKIPIRRYYWSVQAVDSAYTGGPWAAENSIFTPRISGYIRLPNGTGVAGVTVSASNGGTSWTTDSTGYYEVWVLGGWSGNVSVSKTGYRFDQTSRSYTNVTTDQDNQNFYAGTIADIGAGLEGMYRSSVAWGDFDNDGDLDLAVCGFTLPANVEVTRIYQNNGGSFVDLNAGLAGASNGSIAWGDYDGDGDLDLVVTGNVTRIYRNNGDKTFTDISAGLLQVTYSCAAWGDYDNDGDLDLSLIGYYYDGQVRCAGRIYRNNGSDNFTDMGDLFQGVYQGQVAWADYDGDGDLDLIVSGNTSANVGSTTLYRNDGNGVFTANTNSGLPSLYCTAVAWGDYDNDGYPDMAMCGCTTGGGANSGIYHNNGSGVFTQNSSWITSLNYGSVAWGDYDNDGRLDLAIAGSLGYNGSCMAEIYRGSSDGSFTDVGFQIPGARDCALAWGDYDNDGDLDLAYSGDAGYQGGKITRIYRNDHWVANTAPGAPSGLTATPNGLGITFNWTASSDTQTLVNGLAYNLQVGTSPGAGDVFAGMADMSNGLRRLPMAGNAREKLSWTIKCLRPGTYYARVQAIDTSFKGSQWSSQCSASLSGIRISGYLRFSGGAVAPGIAVAAASGGSTSVTNSSGYYEVYVPSGWSGTVLPTASLITFSPASRAYTSVTSNQSNQDFTLYSYPKISGYVRQYNGTGIANVKVSAGSNQVNTDSNGYFEFRVPYSWSGTVVPSSILYAFSPLDRSYTNVIADQANQNFASGQYAESSAAFTAGSKAVWGDYNGDGRLDVAVTGNGATKIYRNDGGEVFSETASLIGVYKADIAWGDYDSDGDLDLALLGCTSSTETGSSISRIYRNDSGVFTDISAGVVALSRGTVAWGDCDGDGDLDLALSGLNNDGFAESRIYRNCAGSFMDIAANLQGVCDCALAWADYDDDGDMDLALSGASNGYGGPTSKLYRNDAGIFTDSGVSLTGAYNSSLAWGDYDNDGDQDLFLFGVTNTTGSSVPVSAIYTNLSGGTFSSPAAISSALDPSMALGDYDGDGDLDIALSGKMLNYMTYSYVPITIVLQNSGTSFNQIPVTVTGAFGGSVGWGDYDNDGDLDLLVAGSTGSAFTTKINRSEGWAANAAPTVPTGLSSTISGVDLIMSWNTGTDSRTPANGLSYNIRVGTASGKGDVFSGMANAATGLRFIPCVGNAQKRLTWKAKGLQAGTYFWSVQAVDTSFAGSAWAAEKTATVVGRRISGYVRKVDGTPIAGVSIIATNAGMCNTNAQGYYQVTVPNGWSGTITPAKDPLYFEPLKRTYTAVTSDRAGQDFTSGGLVDSGASIVGVFSSALAWGDYDNDGDLDLAAFGYASDFSLTGKLYRNQNGSLTDSGISLPGVVGDCAWADYDNDGDLDLAVAGMTVVGYPYAAMSKIYQNSNGTFTQAASLAAVIEPSVAWGDYDNDGDLDLVISGRLVDGGGITKIYRNDGANTFTDIGAQVLGVYGGKVAWADYDNDGDLDLSETGYTGTSLVSKIYRNDAGTFRDGSASLRQFYMSTLAWADYDNDGDLDLAIAGNNGSPTPPYSSTILYRNDGGGVFVDSGAQLPGVGSGTLTWADFDNDGDVDLTVSGYGDEGRTISKIFRNDGGMFSDSRAGIRYLGEKSAFAWGDYDGDGDLDLAIAGSTGISPNYNPVTTIYRNDAPFANTVPLVPTDPMAIISGNDATFIWGPASDGRTPLTGLSYNLRVGTSPGSGNIFSGMASSTGQRKLPALGNAQSQLIWTLKNVPMGPLYWSVQAIDTSFAGSSWTPEQCTVINLSGYVKTGAGYPIAGVVLTANTGETATTDASGHYNFTFNSGWGGTITPAKDRFSFNPPSATYDILTADELNHDFTAISEDTIPPTLTGLSITPPMVKGGDLVDIYIDAIDVSGVASVKADDISLIHGAGNRWSGSISALSVIGIHPLTIVAYDNAGNRSSLIGSYKTCKLLGTSCRNASGVMPAIRGDYLFCFWGRVVSKDAYGFSIDDGANSAVRIVMSSYTGIFEGQFIVVRGILNPSVVPPELTCPVIVYQSKH